jgi:hypothetical protein
MISGAQLSAATAATGVGKVQASGLGSDSLWLRKSFHGVQATRSRGGTLWIVAGGVIQGPVPSTFMRERSGGVFEAPLSMLGA